MLFPTYVLDNFFDDPYKVIKFASSLTYKQDPEGIWPGKRTDALQHIDDGLFQHVTNKMMRLIYPETIKQLTWNAHAYFQYTDYGVDAKEGFIHKDPSAQLSSVIYLSHHKKCGTSLYKPKSFLHGLEQKYLDVCKDYYLKNKILDNKYFKALNSNNSKFEKTLQIDSCFNRFVAYDAHQWHSADGFFNKDIKEGRLTLVIFINGIFKNDTQLKFPVPEMKRTI
jgi:hypothetical protein|tara:strand:- start:196 stop:867 length:672 start_codon:yes stop_codon:yes gene_type:complete